MMKHGLRLSMALVLGTGLAGMAFAQGAGPGATQPGPAPQPSLGGPGPTTGGQPTTPLPGAGYNAGSGGATAMPQLSPQMIKQAQWQLKSGGLYKGAIDGRVGPGTRAAVRRFQQQNGLKTTAMLDQQTLQRLMQNQSHG